MINRKPYLLVAVTLLFQLLCKHNGLKLAHWRIQGFLAYCVTGWFEASAVGFMHRYHLARNGRKHEGVLQAEPVNRIGGQWLLLFPAFMLQRQQLFVPIENGYLPRLVAVLVGETARAEKSL